MATLSISRAWDETKAHLARDGKLFVSVALALIALPAALGELLVPRGTPAGEGGLAYVVVMVAGSIVALTAQLALIRLALGPSTTVREAIGHGVKRTPVYLLTMLLILAILALVAIPVLMVLSAQGVSFEPGAPPPPLPALLLLLAALIILLFLAVRMLMASPAASAEPIGPIAIIRRSWQLSSGHGARLFGFLAAFLIAVGITLGVVSMVTETVAKLLLGPIEPLTASALFVALVTALFNAIASTIFIVMIARIYAQLAGAGTAAASVPSSSGT